MVGSMGDATTTSFFPAKPLGCYGDGGAIFTQNENDAEIINSIRLHGKGSQVSMKIFVQSEFKNGYGAGCNFNRKIKNFS